MILIPEKAGSLFVRDVIKVIANISYLSTLIQVTTDLISSENYLPIPDILNEISNKIDEVNMDIEIINLKN